MQLGDWLAQFRTLHGKAKNGCLSAAERSRYEAAREDLARTLLAGQRVKAPPGGSCSSALRVGLALQATLEGGAAPVRAITVDLSTGGFGALLAKPLPEGERMKVTLRLPGGVQVQGAARVVGVSPREGNARVSFAFEAISPEDRARIEALVFDTVLDHLRLDAAKA